jgi:protein CpxP
VFLLSSGDLPQPLKENSMKRMFVPAALALALAASVAVAQNPTTPSQDGQKHFRHGHHQPNPQRQANHIGKELNLTPETTAKLAPIFASRDEQMKALFQSHQNGQPQDFRQQMHAIQQSTNQQLATVLTPQQLEQLKSIHHGRGERGDHWQHHGPPPQA